MIKFFEWLFSPTEKPILEDIDVYSELLELKQRVEILEAENVETTNTIYEIANSLESRIDILTLEHYTYKNVTKSENQ